MSFFRVASVSLLVFGSACALPEEDTNHVDLPILAGCDDWGCGTNSPEIDHLGVHDINGDVAAALKNANGFIVRKIEYTSCPGGVCSTKVMKRAWVERSLLMAEDGLGFVVGGTGMPTAVGLSLYLENAGTGAKYEITVMDTGRVSFWAHAAGHEVAISYDLRWDIQVPPGQKRNWKSICKKPPTQGDPEAMGMVPYHSVVFENDEIDAVRKTVGLRKEPSWFNIGCAGHALAKLHLTGHSSGAMAQYPAFATTAADRQTMLKMITAAYCPSGYAFTKAGQPLGWLDAPGWNVYATAPSNKEAEWSEKGAKCLNKPRLLGDPAYPTLLDDIKAECGELPPLCPNADPYSLNGAHVISSNM